MNSIAFVPASRALFIADAASERRSGEQPHALLARLRTHGWPTQARLLLPGTELAFRNTTLFRSLAQNNLLPQAELTFQAALAGYESGKVDFATLLDAQRELQDSSELQAL